MIIVYRSSQVDFFPHYCFQIEPKLSDIDWVYVTKVRTERSDGF